MELKELLDLVRFKAAMRNIVEFRPLALTLYKRIMD
jgi:hypothetical protein